MQNKKPATAISHNKKLENLFIVKKKKINENSVLLDKKKYSSFRVATFFQSTNNLFL